MRKKQQKPAPAVEALIPADPPIALETWPLDKCVELPGNPRARLAAGDPETLALDSSLDQFGYVSPLIVNRATGHVLSGNRRLRHLQRRNPSGSVQVAVVDVPIAKEIALSIALNRNNGRWNDAELALALADIRRTDIGLVPALGFTDSELDALAILPSADPVQPMEIPRPPAFTWLLIGIPTMGYGKIADAVLAIESTGIAVVAKCVTDGPERGVSDARDNRAAE